MWEQFSAVLTNNGQWYNGLESFFFLFLIHFKQHQNKTTMLTTIFHPQKKYRKVFRVYFIIFNL